MTWKRTLRWYSVKYVWSSVGPKGTTCDRKRKSEGSPHSSSVSFAADGALVRDRERPGERRAHGRDGRAAACRERRLHVRGREIRVGRRRRGTWRTASRLRWPASCLVPVWRISPWCHNPLLSGWKISAKMPPPNHSGSLHGTTMSDLRERPALRKRDQPRQQYAASPLEPQSASRPRTGERGAQADTRLHCLPAFRSREEGCLIRRNNLSGQVVTW